MQIDDLLERFEGVKPLPAGGHMVLCPAHDDRNASLKIDEGEDRFVLHCHAGCATTDVLRAVGLRWQDLVYDEPGALGASAQGGGSSVAPTPPAVVATYDYTDADGNLLYQVLRMEPKGFRQRRPDGDGWAYSLEGVERVPYRLPELLALEAGASVFITEGEKCADAIVGRGGNATTNSGGAGKWDDAWGVYFFEKHVIIVADKDEPGRKHARQVKKSVEPYAASVRVVEAKEGKDAYDHLAAGYGSKDFVPVDLDAPVFRFQSLDLDEPVEPAEWLLEDLVCMGDVTLLYGPPGAGKTWFAYGLELAVGRGLPFFLGKNVLKHGKCLHLDEEMPRDLVKSRLSSLGITPDWKTYLRYLWRQGIRLDDHPEWVIEEAKAFNPVLITIDSFTRVHRAEENAVEGIGRVLSEGILPLARETGAAVLLMHHSSRAGNPRGSSDIEAAVDAVIKIEPDEENRGRFSISQGKTRRSRGGGKVTVDILDQSDGTVTLYPHMTSDWRAA